MGQPKCLGYGNRNRDRVYRIPCPEGVPTSEEHRLAWAAHRWVCGD